MIFLSPMDGSSSDYDSLELRGSPENSSAYQSPGGEHAISSSKRVDDEERSDKLTTADKLAIGAGVTALAGGIGAALYTHWDDIKSFFKWGNLASGAMEDSALLLETKLDHATALCDEHLVEIDALRAAISAANVEAHKLVSINKQLRGRLDEVRAVVTSTGPEKGS